MGIGSVRGVGDELADAIAAGRPYTSMEDLRRRVPDLTLAHLEALATAGAFEECLALGRREALWQAGAVAQSGPGRLAGIVTGAEAPTLPGMEPREEAVADLWATGVSPDGHPTRFWRDELTGRGVHTAEALRSVPHGTKVVVGGVVTHRQRPATAQGITFVNLEDETGFVNVIVSKGCWAHHRRVATGAPALVVRGVLERQGDVVNIRAEHLEPLLLGVPTKSRDFR